jgi:hypothetical protein
MAEETKEAWAVLVNTDLTEGRGRRYVKHLCEMEATAVRRAHKADVQGSNGMVVPVELVKRNNTWLGPVEIERPTSDDQKTQLVIDAKRKAEEKARSLGLTDDELAALRR